MIRVCPVFSDSESRGRPANEGVTGSLEDAASYHTWAAMSWYGGNETGNEPGAFPDKWWEGAALFHSALQYWFTSGDSVYNEEMKVGMQKQAGKNGDYMPAKYSSYLVRGSVESINWFLC